MSEETRAELVKGWGTCGGLTYKGIAYEGHYEDLWMISCLFKVAQRPQGTVLLGYVATGIVLTFDGSSLQDVYRRAIGKGAAVEKSAVEKSIGRQHQLRFFFPRLHYCQSRAAKHWRQLNNLCMFWCLWRERVWALEATSLVKWNEAIFPSD